VLEQLIGIAAEVMGSPVEASTPLMAAGLDSLAAVELKNAVAARFGVTLPATVAFDYPTLDSMATFVASSMPTMDPQTDAGNTLGSCLSLKTSYNFRIRTE
jgi:acyl carrier protein